MTRRGFTVFPPDDPQQQLRLRRFFIALAAYGMNQSFVLVCWWLGYFSTQNAATFTVLAVITNACIYTLIRSGFNKRFSDPSLTATQMIAATLAGSYLMYNAADFRSTFLMLSVVVMVFGMFRFKTRGFLFFAMFILLCYATVIELLLRFRPNEIHLKVEVLQWMALFVTLAQLTFLASYIGNLRRKLHINNQELGKRNQELEVALKCISDMAIHDELTGVYNRRYLMDRIDEETERCVRTGAPFCLCVIDIDYFKRINDTYGHQAGDTVLQRVAAAAASALRQTDVFGRLGGEEFVAVLIDSPAEGAAVSAERIRRRIEQLDIPDVDPALEVTVSIGIAQHERQAMPSRTFKLADDALYQAKQAGRNRCVLADTSLSSMATADTGQSD